MIRIGITGGVGAGKSAVLKHIEENYPVRLLVADEAVHRLEEPGQTCFERLVEEFGEKILTKDGYLDKKVFAGIIFSDEEALKKANGILHPAVREYIRKEMLIEEERNTPCFVLEAALLIEERYDLLLDELWYVYASEETRILRLMENRGYSREKCLRIMAAQSSEENFRAHCDETIDNDGSVLLMKAQVDALFENRKISRKKG